MTSVVRVSRAVAVGIAALVLSFFFLRTPTELGALMLRRHWPNAWFSGLIVWYAEFLALGVSLALGAVVGYWTLKATSLTRG